VAGLEETRRAGPQAGSSALGVALMADREGSGGFATESSMMPTDTTCRWVSGCVTLSYAAGTKAMKKQQTSLGAAAAKRTREKGTAAAL
jgi:hypothetical protein